MSDLKQVIEESFQQYSGAVLQSRALVDVRDCVKPSARQMFYCMNYEKMDSHHDFKKTLRAIAAGMRVYIHGDASAEGIIMRASQPFAMRYPLVEVEGSNGNVIETGNWSAPRYTASRLSELADCLFADIDKETISEWRDNYDDTFPYPAVLPSKGFYNLVNGTYGIGIGVSASIPSFNIKELNNALITLIKNPEASYNEIYCPPDFATGGILINEVQVKESLRTGHGKACILRAKFNYDEKTRTLTVYEIPYGVYTNTICKELEEIVNGEENPGIDRFNDLTGEQPNIKIYLSKKVNKDSIINYLYKNTSLQASYGINMTMLDSGRYPKVFGWKEVLQAHLAHEKEVYIRGYNYDLDKIEHRIKIINAIMKAIENVEEVIATIKTADSTADANAKLQKLLDIDEEQAKAILDIKLARLAKLNVQEYKEELSNLINEKNRITAILLSEELFNAEVIKGYQKVIDKYGDARRTELTQIEEETLTEEIESKFVYWEDGLIKVTDREPILQDYIQTSSKYVYTFDNKGNRNKIELKSVSSKGYPIANDIVYITNEEDKSELAFITNKGSGKRTAVSELISARNNPSPIFTPKDGEKLCAVCPINKGSELIFVTKKGQVLRVKADDLSAQGKAGKGTKTVGLKEDDEVIFASTIGTKQYLVFISGNGYAKKILTSEFKPQNKGGKGIMGYKITTATGELRSAHLVNNNEFIGKVKVEKIPEVSKTARGNHLF